MLKGEIKMNTSLKSRFGTVVVSLIFALIFLTSCSANIIHTTFNDTKFESKPEFSLTDEGPAIRYAGEKEWTLLGNLIPVPDEWADQDFAGRNEISNMSNVLVGIADGSGTMAGAPNPTAFFLNADDGWFVFSLPVNLGPVDDTYIYRTEDGGHSWSEISHLTGADYNTNWFSTTCLAFSNENRGFLGTGLFTGAPVLVTNDGGYTWDVLDLPFLDDGITYQADHIIFYGTDGVITFHNGNAYTAITTSDYGESWNLSSPRFAFEEGGGPAYLPFTLEHMPTTIYSDSVHDNDPIQLLAELPEQGIRLYRLSWASVGIGGTLLIAEEDSTIEMLSHYDLDITPHSMDFYDYDDDGNMEIVVVADNHVSGELATYLFKLGESFFEEVKSGT